MAKRRVTSAKQRTAARKNIRKAQLVSARKRKRAPNKRRPSNGRKAAVVAGVSVAAVVGGVAIRHHVREHALQKKHGEDFVPRKATYHHYTNNNAARRIAKTRKWKVTGKNGGHGHHEGVWLTHVKGHGTDSLTRDVFGKARVSVRLSRKEVLGSRTHSIPGGLDKTNRKITHVQVHKSLLQGKRVRHNLPKTARGTRSRAQASRRYTIANPHLHTSSRRSKHAYGISRNMAVNPVRRNIKRVLRG